MAAIMKVVYSGQIMSARTDRTDTASVIMATTDGSTCAKLVCVCACANTVRYELNETPINK